MAIKRGISLVVVLLFFIFLISKVSAIGVSPAIYKADFVPEFEENFNFNFNTEYESQELEIYVGGDLAEYVTLNVDRLTGSGSVNAYVKLPRYVEVPGRHRIEVGARPYSGSSGGTVGAVVTVRGVIDVYVPYPGKYADIKFSISNANIGEKVPYTLEIYSRGKEAIVANSRIDIYNSRNESVKSFNLKSHIIPPTENVKVESQLDVSGLGAGDYWAEVVVTYAGDERRLQGNFKLGELNVQIVNYTKMLKKDKINPFEIEVESLWNDPIKEIYGEVSVVGTDLSFRTLTEKLEPWRRIKLKGFFDTSELEDVGENLEVKMVVHYDGETTEETAILSFLKTTNYVLIISIVAGIIGVFAFVAGVVVKLKKLEGKSGKRKKS